ncbi:MAG TPA: hypothetical protein P5548_02940 [Candidatus Moranbacteria bacterium]|nr:hypothetical protein [Candidatus Moranbacteria bacterium]HRZ33825.1 hypothetical protein [Candidatus Moranbacteria bacterium]
MNKKPKIHLETFEEYCTSILRYIEWMLHSYFKNTRNISIENIKKHEKEINAYENFNYLSPINESKITVLDDDKINTAPAEKAILDGKLLWEHAAAGEATRLGLGTKYLLNLSRFSLNDIVSHIRQENIKELEKKGFSKAKIAKEKIKINKKINRDKILKICSVDPLKVADISLGNRHMLQMAFDINEIAKRNNQDPIKVLGRQTALIILNEQTAEEILEEFKSFNFFGLNPKKIYFMIQRSFHGIYVKEGCLYYDSTTEKNKRLHNHGQLFMQKIHNNVIFRVNPRNTGKKIFISNTEFEKILSQHEDLLSYNIDDLGYLTCAIDLPSLSMALNLGKKGYAMVMEIVGQNPLKPQKGGACFFDKKLKRVIMIETNQLKNIKNEDIKHLNKNFNHYPNPAKSYRIMKEKGLPITFEVKNTFNQNGDPCDYLYANPVQGNINFMVKTAYVMRKNLKPIYNWKSASTTPLAVKAMYEQDKQPGFKDFVKKIKK